MGSRFRCLCQELQHSTSTKHMNTSSSALLPPRPGDRVVVAMSGGVDSSLAAALLREQGYEVVGITMHLWDFDQVGGNIHSDSSCCSTEGADDARAVCDKLGVPHYVVDFRDAFEANVVRSFVQEYLGGRTPNPCVLCNAHVKWGALLRKTQALGADYLATGHYARVRFDPDVGRVVLRKGLDEGKDQSYALWQLDQPKLRRTIFPLGELRKSDARRRARSLGLKVSDKAESQEICFLPDNDYERFLRERVGSATALSRGPIFDRSGRTLGQHRGVALYTVGQRKGLGIAAGKPLYVTRLDAERNALWVGDLEALKSDTLIAAQPNWIAIERLEHELRVHAKIRYLHSAAPVTIRPKGTSHVLVRFQDPQYAIAPGQSVVFYDGDRVVGGGVIEQGGL